MKITARLGDKELGSLSIEDRLDMPVTFKRKDYVEGSAIIETESGVKLKLPCKIYDNKTFVANLNDEYEITGNFNIET